MNLQVIFPKNTSFQNFDAMKILDVDQQSHTHEKVVQLPLQTRTISMMSDGVEVKNWFINIKMMIKGNVMVYKRIPYNLMNIDLSSNKFYGEIPESIGGLVWLYSLNLSNNDLTGSIPSSLANLTNLVALDLSKNMLLERDSSATNTAHLPRSSQCVS